MSDRLALRLIPAAQAQGGAWWIVSHGGWVILGAPASLIEETLGRPQTLALTVEGPEATPEELDRIRAALVGAADAPGDLGNLDARAALERLDSARGLAVTPADVDDRDAPAPARAPSPEPPIRRRAAVLTWRGEGGGRG